ncbi:hypothetical protein [Streptomyces mirabilis]|uniref:hypothetical protein n=1 Tax=Streptomyces mirabilis TaxID=68239 RepID=UPI0036A7C1C7
MNGFSSGRPALRVRPRDADGGAVAEATVLPIRIFGPVGVSLASIFMVVMGNAFHHDGLTSGIVVLSVWIALCVAGLFLLTGSPHRLHPACREVV